MTAYKEEHARKFEYHKSMMYRYIAEKMKLRGLDAAVIAVRLDPANEKYNPEFADVFWKDVAAWDGTV